MRLAYSLFCSLFLPINLALCYDVGHVYYFSYDSITEISKHSVNSSLPNLTSSIHVEFQVEPLEYNELDADLLLINLQV